MKHRIHIKKSRVFVYLFMIALVAFTSLPLILLVSNAFKPVNELLMFPPRFFPQQPSFNNFSDLLLSIESAKVPFSRSFFNSVAVSAATVAFTVLICSMAAYALSKLPLPLSNVIFSVIVASLMIAPPTTQLTSYTIISRLGMMNNYAALIVPKLATAYYLFLLKQSFVDIPGEILEAAKIDGCSPYRIYRSIILPMAKPALATVVVFSFVANWNDFYAPMLYISRQSLKTLPLALQTLQGGAGQIATTGAFAAAVFITTVPTILIFLAMQSQVVKTMAHSGIK